MNHNSSSQHNNAALRTALGLLLVLATVLAFSLPSFASSSGKSASAASGTASASAAVQTGPEAKPTRESSQKPTITTGNHVRIRRPPPPIVTPGANSINLIGTAWRGPDFDDNLTRTFEFLPGGNLKMTGQDGTVYYGTWSMTGANRFHIDINGYTREGTVTGNVINGTGLVQGRPFTWRATRIASPGGGGGAVAGSVEGTTWDWRDSNDRGYVYEYLPGGRLRATDTRNGQVITNCQWSQQGSNVTMTFDAGAREQGAISGSQMGGTGLANGDQYTWTANKITDSVNRNTAENLNGTMWRGPDHDDNLTRTFEFLSGGDLKMTGQDGTVYHGTWRQSGNLFHIDINGYTREGLIVGRHIKGSGFVSGRPFSWDADYVGPSGGSGSGGGIGTGTGGGTYGSLLGTRWRGPDFDDNLVRTYEFLPNGDLKMTGQDGTVYHGTWSQNGNRFHIDINDYTRDGVINGNTIEGTGLVQGRPFTWRATRIDGGGGIGTGTGGGSTSGSLAGTIWRGPDFDDNITRTFEFVPGGVLRLTNPDGTVYQGTWSQTGNRFHIDINNYTRDGVVNGDVIEGTGLVQGRPFTWRANRIGGGGGGGSTSMSVMGTTWRGPDYDDNLVRMYEFLPGGDLKMTGQDGTVYHGTWSQNGNRIHIDINGYTRDATIQGSHLDGTGVVQGRPFTWSAERINGYSNSAPSLLGTRWRGPDFDDNLVRTYEFLSGGRLKMTGQDGTVYNGTWSQTGNTLHIDINGYTREGVINGNTIEGTGLVQGRPFTWRATRLSGSGGGGEARGAQPANIFDAALRTRAESSGNATEVFEAHAGSNLYMMAQRGSIVGTRWRGPDYDDNLVRTYEFFSGGVLRMTGQDGTVYHGTWWQRGNRIHIDINDYTRDAVIQGNHLDGTGVVQGRRFTWSAERIVASVRLLGTRWRGPDYDDNLVRTYSFLGNGRLRMVGQDGTVYFGTWTQSGNQVHIDINGYTRDATIQGNHLEGTGVVQGRSFTWSATRIN